MLQNITIILVEPSHPGNIGAAARALKNMGLSRLTLVNPKEFPSAIATERAVGAGDLLAEANVVDTLEEALVGAQLILGCSARDRSLPWPMLSAREAGEHSVKTAAQDNQVVMLFGRERNGLTREELQFCHYHVQIPTNPEYSSLNLAQAIQVLTYEMRMASQLNDTQAQAWDCDWSSFEDMEHFYAHLTRVMLAVGFMDPSIPRNLLSRIKRLFNRSKIDRYEMGILRGFLAMIENKIE